MWKLSLLGYREKDVEIYIRDIAEARGAEIAAFEEKIRAAEDMNLHREELLTELRGEVYRRRSQLETVEKELVLMYYRAVQTQLGAERRQAAEDPGAGNTSTGKQENLKMKKYPSLNTSLLGVSQKELDSYLAGREKEHRVTIDALTEKLSRLEEAVAAQTDEIKVLEELLHRPELQQPFIDLAYRYLDRIEQILSAPDRTAMQATRRTAAARQAAKQTEAAQTAVKPAGAKPSPTRQMAARQAALKQAEAAQTAGRQIAVAKPTTPRQATAAAPPESEPAGVFDKIPLAPHPDEGGKPVFSTAAGAAGTIHPFDSALRTGRKFGRYPERVYTLQYNYLAGKTAGEDVIGRRGELLLGKGELISAESAARVREQGRIEQLVRNLNVGPGDSRGDYRDVNQRH